MVLPAMALFVAATGFHTGTSPFPHGILQHTWGRAHSRSGSATAGILKNINPRLTADLLYALRSAGHGDVIAVVDANFPASSTASACIIDEPVMLAGTDCVSALASVMPIDRFVATPFAKMMPSEGDELPALGAECHELALSALGGNVGVQEIDRFSFYALAEDAYVIVQCGGERRPYGCFLLTKGVVGPDGNDLMP